MSQGSSYSFEADVEDIHGANPPQELPRATFGAHPLSLVFHRFLVGGSVIQQSSLEEEGAGQKCTPNRYPLCGRQAPRKII